MLEQKDLQAIAELMDCRISKTEEKMIKEMDTRISEVEMTLTNKIEAVDKRVSEVETNLTNKILEVETSLTNKITEVESFLAKELVRTEDILNRKIEKIDNKLAEIDGYYRVEKLENGNTGMILQILEEYQERLKNLEMKIA